MADDDSEKSHEPTQKRLDDARKKGEVAKSADLVTASGYGGFLLTVLALGATTLPRMGAELAGMLERASTTPFAAGGRDGTALAGQSLIGIGALLAPWFALPAGLALLALLAQRALVFAPSKLEPKLSRISLISNAGQKFGRAGLFEFAKSLAKLLLYSCVLGTYLILQSDRIAGLSALGPRRSTFEILDLVTGLLLLVLTIALGLGVIDLIFQRSEHLRRNRMSRKELTDEAKESEGDPHLKQQRRQKAVSIATNRMLAEVPKADVVIVNPTHYAVALKWDRSGSRAPVCVAKGVDEVAARMRQIAAEHAVPIRSDPPTARAIHATVDIGQEIAREHYRAVAAAIRFAESIRRKAART